MKRKEYAQITGSIDVMYDSLENLLYSGRLTRYTAKDKMLLESLQAVIAQVQDHFWHKSLNKKEKKILNTVGGVLP